MLKWNIISKEFKSLKTSSKSLERKSSPFSEKENEWIKNYEKALFSSEVGFFRLPDDEILFQQAQSLYQKFRHKKYFIHIGIGGSSLGPEMLISALGHGSSVSFIFINNVDPDDIHHKIQNIPLEESLIYVVSKSGSTVETMASLIIMINKLKSLGVEEKDFKDSLVFCTDPENGELREISEQWNISTLDIPSSVGGRFSVLSPVGLFPAFFAGINVESVLEGAKSLKKDLIPSEESSHFISFATLGFWLKALYDQNINQTVLMPYSSKLRKFSSWFVQLWAESLGKDGQGLTPIPAYGATDQHSQMQLFMEGPSSKALFLLEIANFKYEFSMENSVNSPTFRNLSGHHLTGLLKAELQGTLKALEEKQRPVCHLSIPEINEKSLGELIIFFECLTVLMSSCLSVNPFNQPGVEAGKKYAKDWLNKTSL